MKRKILVGLVAMVFLATLIGCATIEEQWAKRTPDEQARIITNGIQEQLNDAFDISKAYVVANPKYQEKWIKEIVPAFKIANETTADVLLLAKSGQITPDQVYAKLSPLVNKVMNYLVSIGAVQAAKKLSMVIPLKTAAMDVAMILLIINSLLALAFKTYTYLKQVSGDQPIPTWDEILEKNRLLQDKIEAELQGESPPEG